MGNSPSRENLTLGNSRFGKFLLDENLTLENSHFGKISLWEILQ